MTTSYAVPGTPFAIDTTVTNVNVCELHITIRGRGALTPAGFLAVLGEIYGYYNTSSGAKIASVAFQTAYQASGLHVHLEGGSASYTVAAADAVSEVANLAVILQTAANIAA